VVSNQKRDKAIGKVENEVQKTKQKNKTSKEARNGLRERYGWE
jgi:hypothetical protein